MLASSRIPGSRAEPATWAASASSTAARSGASAATKSSAKNAPVPRRNCARNCATGVSASGISVARSATAAIAAASPA